MSPIPDPPHASRAAAVIVAAGDSTRMGAEKRKPLLTLAGRTLIEHTLAAFDRAPSILEIVIVAHPADVETLAQMARDAERLHPAFMKVRVVVPGGRRRTHSVRHGARSVSPDIEVVLVHDAARPLVTTELIEQCAQVAQRDGASVAAVPVNDTLKTSASGTHAERTLDRSVLWAAQTPQGFRRAVLIELLARAEADEFEPTDDCALHERYLGPVTIVPGDPRNLKVTTPSDIVVAEALLAARAKGAP
ncbi:MAG TPA: 2-C-methyl-D-erythritol 4-phosphate cytidylyltransferase [Planctomycetota bacterium]|nr:2-C-methyl-D-erythritol 4-phosphate cytidylyltransferase [Planctomycetota bacterium]